MLGATDPIAERVTPILETMGAKLIRTGAVGSAHAMKALNNYVYAAGLLAASEAMLLGQAMNLDLGVLVDVLNASSGRNVATETKLKQHMLDGGDFKAGFGLHLMAKDLGIAHGLKNSAGFTPRSSSFVTSFGKRLVTTCPRPRTTPKSITFLKTACNPRDMTALQTKAQGAPG